MEIWVHKDGQLAGRFSESAIREKFADGSFSAEDLAWSETKSAWQPIPEFLESLPKANPESAATSSTQKAAVELVAKPDSAAVRKQEAEPADKTASTAEPDSPRPSGAKPPPLPTAAAPIPVPVSAARPPPLPAMPPGPSVASGPASSVPATPQPPEGETIWSPWVAILGSVFLSPAFGGLIVWRNWLAMKRRRRALVAAPWFWLGFVVVGLVFYSRSGLSLVIWMAYLVAWIAFSAFPQIRYIQTTFKREKTRWGLPLVAALILFGVGFAAFQIAGPRQKTTLEPRQEQPTTTTVTTTTKQELSQPQSQDRVFSAEELRDIYKSSVLEVRATWNERRSYLNKKENGANGTGVLIYNDNEYGLVATNWHVVEPSENMTGDYKCGVRFSHDKEFADCLLVARAKNDVDLALLLVRLDGDWTPNQFPVRALDQIKEGECCIAIGNALGEGLSITAGIISRFDKVKDQTLIRTSTPVSPGNSGGPLILCRGGALAGIVTLQSRITNVQNVNFATPAQLILDKDIWDFESDQEKAQQLLDKAIAQAAKK
jgi:S1-C subfamily serine protease